MPELVPERRDAVEAAVKVSQNAELPDSGNPGTKGTSHFSFPREEIDPLLAKSFMHNFRHFGIKCAEYLQQICFRLFYGIFLSIAAHGCKQIIPRQSIGMPQCLSLIHIL